MTIALQVLISGLGGTSALLVLAIALGSVALAGGGVVLWAHS